MQPEFLAACMLFGMRLLCPLLQHADCNRQAALCTYHYLLQHFLAHTEGALTALQVLHLSRDVQRGHHPVQSTLPKQNHSLEMAETVLNMGTANRRTLLYHADQTRSLLAFNNAGTPARVMKTTWMARNRDANQRYNTAGTMFTALQMLPHTGCAWRTALHDAETSSPAHPRCLAAAMPELLVCHPPIY